MNNFEQNIIERHKRNLVIGLIIAALALICNALFAQLPTREGKVFYETIDTVNLSKEDLYNKAKLWLVNTFNDSKAVIEIDDKGNGQIVGKGNFTFTWKYAFTPLISRCLFVIKMDIKDNKYRMQIYNVDLEGGQANIPMDLQEYNEHPNKGYSKKILPEIDKGINDLFASFKSDVTKSESTF